MSGIIKSTFIIAKKELLSEWKNKQMISTMLIFSMLVLITFSFAFNPTNELIKLIVPGIIWVTIIFSGLLGLNRSFISETKNDTLQGIMIAPIDPISIYLGKTLANLVFVFLVELITIPLIFIFFNVQLQRNIGLFFVLVLFLGTFGFISIGTFLAALSANSRASEMLLPIILFPVVTPIIIGAVQATKTILFDFEEIENAISWNQLLGAYDVIFFALAFILFDYIMEV